MAPLPEIEDVFRVAFRWDAFNAVNVTHFHAPTKTAPQVYITLNDHVTKEMWGVCQTGVHISQVDITPLVNDAGTFSVATGSPTKWSGKGTGDLVVNCAAVLSQKTVFRGPSHRGRMFIGPMCESFLANGMVITGNRTELVDAWTAFQAAIIADGMEHCVASYQHQTATTVLAYNVRSAAGTIRKRQDRLAS